MKKLILITLIALFALSITFADTTAKTNTSSSVDMVLNMTKIPTRVNVGFASAPVIPSAMSLSAVPNTITLLDIPVTITADHAELASSVDFYIWYYISTTSTKVSVDFSFTNLTNGATTNAHYIGYKMQVVPYKNDESNTYYEGLEPTIHGESSVTLNAEETEPGKIQLMHEKDFTSINKGYYKATVSSFNYDRTKLTNSQYHSTLTVTISAI